MPHHYWLATPFSPVGRIEISESEHGSLRQALDSLLHCVEAEENFEGLLDGYIEFESFVQNEALQELLWREVNDVQAQARRTSAGRKLSYFLSSVRFYLDSVQRHACAILRDTTDDTVIKATRREFDISLSYRIMEALRNHAQHRALPVHGYMINRQWNEDREFFNFSFEPTLDLSELKANPKLRKKTIAEIRILTGPSSIETKPLARSYVESLSNIHRVFRGITSSTIDGQINLIHLAKSRMIAAFPNVSEIGFTIFRTDDVAEEISEPVTLTKTLDDYLKFLRSRNQHLINFSRHRVSY